jgi:RNA polymerase sigma factor (TIGR02999 family)
MSDVTQILNAIEQGDPHAAEQLLPLVYDELRKLAAQRIAQEKPGQTLQATDLVHEAYLRLVASPVASAPRDHGALTQPRSPNFANRGHFFAAAAEAMRRILVDSARRKQSSKRGGDFVRQELDAIDIAIPDMPEDLVALDEALNKLAVTDKTAADLVHLRFFAGLPLAEIAPLLGMSPRTADRLWAYARAWLHQVIQGSSPASDIS